MAQKNDDRILQLKEEIAKRKESLGKQPKFVPETSCILDLDGRQYNLHVECSELLLVKLNMYKMSAKELGINPDTIVLSGFPITKWMEDIAANLEVKEYKKKKKDLDSLEKQLTKLLSDDKQVELQIDSLASLLGGI